MPGAASIPNFEYYITLSAVVKPDSSRIPENTILSFCLIMDRHMYYESGQMDTHMYYESGQMDTHMYYKSGQMDTYMYYKSGQGAHDI